MAMDIFNKIFQNIDSVVTNTITANVSNVANIMSPIFLSGFIVYCLFVFMSYWQGVSVEATIVDMIKRVMSWAVIIGFGINIGAYNDTVVPIVLGLGDGVTQAFNGTTATSGAELDRLGSQLVEIVMANHNKAEQYPITAIGEKIGVIVKNAIIIISFGLFLIIAGAFIILAKIMLAILAVLGPLFIPLFLFPMTRQYAMNWVNQVITFSLYLVLVNVASGVFIGYMNTGFLGIDSSTDSGMIEITLTSLLFFVVLLKLPELASGLGSGIANGGFGAAMTAGGNIKRGLSGAGRGAMGVGSSAKKGYQAVKSWIGGKNRMEQK